MSHADHQRRKRMYPQQINQAYMDQPSSAQSYNQQYPATSDPSATASQYFVPGSQQQPGYPAATAPNAQGYVNQQQPAQQQQAQGYPSSVAGMTNQFSNMGFGGAQVGRISSNVYGLKSLHY
jgi:hypothetical protein